MNYKKSLFLVMISFVLFGGLHAAKRTKEDKKMRQFLIVDKVSKHELFAVQKYDDSYGTTRHMYVLLNRQPVFFYDRSTGNIFVKDIVFEAGGVETKAYATDLKDYFSQLNLDEDKDEKAEQLTILFGNTLGGVIKKYKNWKEKGACIEIGKKIIKIAQILTQ